MWSAMLQEYEELVYIPISSGLSGSCMTAQAMAQEEPYAGRVFVVDNGRVSLLFPDSYGTSLFRHTLYLFFSMHGFLKISFFHKQLIDK